MRKLYVLHGWAYDTEKWRPFSEGLRALGLEVTMLRVPGLTAPLAEVWGLDEYVTWLSEELKGQKNVWLLGHSFGGQIAARFAARYPDVVERLFLVDAAGIMDRSLKMRLKRVVFLILAKVGKMVTRDQRARRLLHRLAREHDYAEASPVMRQVMQHVTRDEVLVDLPKITAKTTIIWGKEDRVTPVKQAYRFNNMIAHSKLRVIDGARHSPQFTHVDLVIKAMHL